jgi:thiosulfate reductase cytochrome b subunit
MKWAVVRAVLMIVGVAWFSFSLFKSALGKNPGLRWYDRTIHFLGAILMAAFAIGAGYLLVTGQLIQK